MSNALTPILNQNQSKLRAKRNAYNGTHNFNRLSDARKIRKIVNSQIGVNIFLDDPKAKAILKYYNSF